jgi:four helix bundle protein
MFIAQEVASALGRARPPALDQLAQHDRALHQQLRNSASSILLNVAEGNRRVGRDRLHFFRIAAGSAAEVGVTLEVAVDWRYVDESLAAELIALVDRELGLLWGLTHRRK